MAERNLIAISIKHTEYRWKFGMPCVLWGHRTQENERRSFRGYTIFPERAELYALGDFEAAGYGNCVMKLDEPVKMEMNLCKKWKKYDTVLVRYEDYILYSKAASLSLDGSGYNG